MNNLERLGQSIYDYFIHRTSPNENFKLCIDSFTYDHCCKLAGLSNQEISELKSGSGIYSRYNFNEALGVVALQIKIAYDIETDEELQNSYNNRLVENISYFNSVQDVEFFYREKQEHLWETVKNYFAKKNRFLDIPTPKEYAGRYVQYPKSQRIISGKQIIEYADKFIKKDLEPNSGITFDAFLHLMFGDLASNNKNMVYRMIFSFYCMWDGRSSKDIINKKERTSKNTDRSKRDEISIKLFPHVSIYINGIEIDLSKTPISEDFLSQIEDKKCYTKIRSCFIEDETYNDWIPTKLVEESDEVLLLTKQRIFPTSIKNLAETGEVEIIDAGIYKLLLLRLKNRKAFDNFNLPLKQQREISLIGGLKAKRKTYYDFALPNVVLLNKELKHLYLDNIEYEIENGIFKIPEKLEEGQHSVMLSNSWDSSEFHFYVIHNENQNTIDKHGWKLDFHNSIVYPTDNIEETVVDGLTLKEELQLIKHKTYKSSLKLENKYYQRFLNRKDELEKRFNSK